MCYFEIKPQLNEIMKKKKPSPPTPDDSFGQLLQLLSKLSYGSSENTVLVIACMSTLAFFVTLAFGLFAILAGTTSCSVQAQNVETITQERTYSLKLQSLPLK